MKHLKLYDVFIKEQALADEYVKSGEETYWQLEDGTTLTLKQVLSFLDEEKVAISEVPIIELKPLLIKVEREASRVEAANLDFPIIVAKHENKYVSILDGQHRLVKSLKNGISEIKCRILNLDNCPELFKKVFIG
jgi:hypothetical protein